MKKELINKIESLNRRLVIKDKVVELVIIGGAALILYGKVDRYTEDLDSFIKCQDEFFSIEQHWIKDMANKYTFNSHAENVVPRIYEMLKMDNKMFEYKELELSNVKIWLASMEFVTFLKILAAIDRGTRKHDYTDLIWVKRDFDDFDFEHFQKFVDFYWDTYSGETFRNKFNKFYEDWLGWVVSDKV